MSLQDVRSRTYRVGNRVIFKRNHQWFEGMVTGTTSSRILFIKECIASASRSSLEEMSDVFPTGNTLRVNAEDVEVLPEEQGYEEKLMVAQMALPDWVDPNSDLYIESSLDFSIEADNPVFNDASPIHMMQLFTTVSNRRKPSSVHVHVQNQELLAKTLLPKHGETPTMLQRADMARYGLGRTKDPELAQQLYARAAWGLTNQEYQNQPISTQYQLKFVYPRGTPEALTAYASSLVEGLTSSMGLDDCDFLGLVHCCKNSAEPQYAWAALHLIVFLLGHAIRRDLTCPLALAIGQAIREAEFLDPFVPDSMQLLCVLEIENEKRAKPMTMARPTKETLELFRPKATRIFLSLPARSMNISGMCRSDVHIWFAEMPFPPYPILPMMFNPPSQYMYGSYKMDSEHELTPYSPVSFAKLWGEVAFEFHRGLNGSTRQRPALITLFNKPGDRQFGEYIKRQLGPNSGTEVRLVSHDYCFQALSGQLKPLVTEVHEMQTGLVAMISDRMNWDPQDLRSPVEQSQTAFANRDELPVEEVLSRCEALKAEGNSFFGRHRWHAAQSCYSEGIDFIRSSINTNGDVFKLLGALLSNRAACFLKTCDRLSPEAATEMLKKAETDYEKALKSPWSQNVAPSVLQKLKRRKQEARKKIDQMAGSFPTWYDKLLENAQERQPRDSAPARRSNHGRRRRNETARQRQRRRRQERRRQNQNESGNDREHSDNEIQGEFEEGTGKTLEEISVFLGGDIIGSKMATNAQSPDDPCPCCQDRFQVEIKRSFAVVLPCMHACCLSCLSMLWGKSEEYGYSFACPCCRVPIPSNQLDDVSEVIVAQLVPLRERLRGLPLAGPEKAHVGRQVLKTFDYRMDEAFQYLDSLLVDNLQAQLRNHPRLSPDEKQQIYEEARAPMEGLFQERRAILNRRQALRDKEEDEYDQLSVRLQKLEEKLIPEATKNAMDQIWAEMNSAGTMSRETETGVVEVDFHALHIGEAKQKFDEQVVPILSVVKNVVLIVGRGKHSDGGVAKLKPALRDHIGHHRLNRQMKCREHPKNTGALELTWKGE